MGKLKKPPKWIAKSLKQDLVSHQRNANQSGLAHRALFEGHRRNTTRVISACRRQSSDSLCVLGAGNCLDLELESVAQAFREVHLVDIDRDALEQARKSLPHSLQKRVRLHAPLDLSGLMDVVERWKGGDVTQEELLEFPERVSQQLLRQIGGSFSVVASSCVLTQLQLSVLMGLGDQHPLFEATRLVVSLAHLRTLARLTEPGGRALLITDLVGSEHYPLHELPQDADLLKLMGELSRQGNVIYVSDPGVLRDAVRQDPVANQELRIEPIEDVWLWQNGPDQQLLVYALPLLRAASTDPR